MQTVWLYKVSFYQKHQTEVFGCKSDSNTLKNQNHQNSYSRYIVKDNCISNECSCCLGRWSHYSKSSLNLTIWFYLIWTCSAYLMILPLCNAKCNCKLITKPHSEGSQIQVFSAEMNGFKIVSYLTFVIIVAVVLAHHWVCLISDQDWKHWNRYYGGISNVMYMS